MPQLQLSSPRKPQCTEQDHIVREISSQKVDHPAREAPHQRPAAFWDNLSKIFLTKPALRELDRRTAQSAPQPLHKPLTRQARTEFNKCYRPLTPVSEFLRDCSLDSLKNIKRLATHGGPDLLHIRGYLQPTDPLVHSMSFSQSRSRGQKRLATSTLKTALATGISSRNTTTYDRNFQQNLIDYGVYPEEYDYPSGQEAPRPNNWDEIGQRLMQPRPSLSLSNFSSQDFKKFMRANTHAFKEKQVTSSIIPIIEGEIEDGRCVASDVLFNNLDHLTDETITPAKPDFFYGARPEQLDRRVCIELSGSIIPSTQNDLPMAPNFFLEVKGPNGTTAVARRQACYNGALGARGIQSLQSYGHDQPVYDNNAYTITSTYIDGNLKLYTCYPTQPSATGARPEYYMNQLRSFAVTDTLETFRHGVTAYRNGRDWAKEQRDKFIESANRRATDLYTAASTSFESSHEVSTPTARLEVTESESSADEFALDNRKHPDPNKRICRRSTSFESSLEVSTPTARLEVTESESSADEFALDNRKHPGPNKRICRRSTKDLKKILCKDLSTSDD